MAGQGSRFQQQGYKKPKPFIDVDGKPMISRVIENLYYPGAKYYLLARKEHLEAEQELVKAIAEKYNAVFIAIDKLTEGTACTVLYARQFINNNAPLLIANSDQIVDCNISAFIDDCLAQKKDGSILTFIDAELNPKWSFAKLDGNKNVIEVQEKKAISEFATVGIYFFTEGRTFVNSAVDMIIANERVNNEFYTCPVYNYAIKDGKTIGIYNIDSAAMHGIGTPEDLDKYLAVIKA